MPNSAFVARVLDQLTQQGPPPGVEADAFQAFTRAVGRQLRTSYQARYSAAEVLGHLKGVYDAIKTRGEGQIQVVARWADGVTEIVTALPDQPFLVDTVLLVLRRHNAAYLGGFNIVLPTQRAEDGTLLKLGGGGDRQESVIRAEVEGIPEEDVPAVQAEILRALQLARQLTHDFPAMMELVDSAAYRFSRLADRMPDQADALKETADFLRWLMNDHFVFMGAASNGARVGLASADLEAAGLWSCASLSEGWEPAATALPVRVRKGDQDSPVHRAGRMDEIRIDVPSEHGADARPLLIQGLFTYKAVTQPSRSVPVLRQTLSRILARDEAKPGSFRYRGVANAFDSLPTEFLFTATPDEIAEMIDRVLEAEQEQRVRVHVRQKHTASMAFVLIAMPKARWSDKMRAEVEAVLVGATQGSYSDHGVFIGRYDTMLLHFYLTGARPLSEEEVADIVARIEDIATPFVDRLYTALVGRYGTDEADELIVRYGSAFGEGYQASTSMASVLRDIEILERMGDGDSVLCDLYAAGNGKLNLRIYERSDIILSDILPVLHNFGLVVVAEYADTVAPRHGKTTAIDTFELQNAPDATHDAVLAVRTLLIDALQAVFSQKMVSDPLNRLLVTAGIPWEAVDLLRAYNGYARQLGQRYTLARVTEILAGQPGLVRRLWGFFETRFNPTLGKGREKAVAKAREAFLDDVRQVQDMDQDATFRTLQNLMDSTLRTNFYRADRPFHYISFKVECSAVRTMPSPRMMYEIYVHHREMEGVHLRGGPIARGGIRWSDREDFRREILGLVTTQMVKNVLIVPEGAKGGFFIKHPHTRDSKALRAKADALYQVLIRGMLDVTDNYVAGKVVSPADVVRWDGDDPYLVVAADKGTAHLSDTANGLSKSYGFWLGDAFASGGSNGYDHKKVGITARGAWVLVKRHFREMGHDPDREVFTAIGIGDTSGDVFGNGVIETPKMKLVAAFNHLHVFLDPNPDPEATYQERLRLFKEAKGWEHYDTSLISAGGGIYDRKAKSIPLSPEVRQLLGALQPELPVDAVLRLILRLDVDLFLNGGIGTYVKASGESHLDAGDPPNDELRVNANELRCRVVAEGGNLGFTQAARIEYAQRGGRINTDAIDNSGGVDLSDHEVNLKILLNPLVAAGRITLDARNKLLESLTDQVAQAVLDDNGIHGRQLSLDQVRSARDPLLFSRTIDWVCGLSGRTRQELSLPSDEDLHRRSLSGQGITRPELAVLQAHVKMHVYKRLLGDDPAPIPDFGGHVMRYFPETVRLGFGGDIANHMLYKNIGMTSVLTEVAGGAGALFFPTLMELTGAPAAAAAGAFLHAMALVRAPDIERELKGCDALSESKYLGWVVVTDQAQSLASLWLAPGEPGPAREDLGKIREALGRIPGARGAAREERARARADQLVGVRIPAALAQRIVNLEDLVSAREIALLQQPGEDLGRTAVRYLAVGEAIRVLPALRALEGRRTVGRWDPVAFGILRNRFLGLLRSIVSSLRIGDQATLGVDRVAIKLGRGALGPLQAEMDQTLGDQPDVATLLVAEERIRAFVARTRIADIEVS